MDTRPTEALALISQQHEVVHVILNKLLRDGYPVLRVLHLDFEFLDFSINCSPAHT